MVTVGTTAAKRGMSEAVVIGLVVMVQGFGSAIAKAGWDANWGLLAVAERWTAVPVWAGVVVGMIGLIVVLFGLRKTFGGSRT